MSSIFETIKKRKSVRTYADKPLEEKAKSEILDFLRSNNKGPFGTCIDFKIIDLTNAEQQELKELASYGNIKGPRYFMAAAVKSSVFSVLDYGYLMEKNILAAAAAGLGTCWIGGSFSRFGFLTKLAAANDEVVPAVVTLGYAAAKRDITDSATRQFVAADTRRPWKDIFFEGSFDNFLNETAEGTYKIPLEALRLAPSASNKQPWRVVYETRNSKPSTLVFHFFLERSPGYRKMLKEDLQLMDIGICMSHFELAAEELGLNGTWVESRPELDAGSREYVMSWVPL
jgi:nitroreductase